ncbi:MAG: chemotaxis-specific protein-glutamate methyltransferase CheB [Bacteriovoracaceae bacterium]
MGIKRLIQKTSESLRFSLSHSGDALIVFKNKDETIECLWLKNFVSKDLEKFSRFKSANEVKFVGDQRIFNEIKSLELFKGAFKKSIFLQEDLEVVFYSDTGKVRISKSFDEKNQKKKVLVVDDSKTIQKILSRIILKSNKLELLAVADGPSEARRIIEQERPDIITLDIHMPEMNGVEFFKTYLKATKIPTVMISSVSMNEGPLVMEALSNGAKSYIQKPSLNEIEKVSAKIISELEVIASGNQISVERATKTLIPFDSLEGLIAIGSSTGGPQALEYILTSLPDEIPPIVIAQHIPEVFSKALADRLNQLCAFRVKEAENGEDIQKNTVYIARGGKQFKVVKDKGFYKSIIKDDLPVNRFKPSVDYLFDSLVSLNERHLLAVILTGMGKDGAEGLLKLKNVGAYTIAEDESSCVVFGMPRRAIELGAVKKVVPLSKISDEIVLCFNQKRFSRLSA